MASITEFFLDRVGKRFDAATTERKLAERRRAHLEAHIRYVDRWSAATQFLGMPAPLVTSSSTVPLMMQWGARRFAATSGADELSELDILRGPTSYLILGDPGAGKTTTLKRLARRLLEPPVDADDALQYPVVIRLREIGPGPYAVMCAIADVLGINYDRAAESGPTGQVERVRVRVASVSKANDVPGESIDAFLPDFLTSTGAMVLLDGLDEVSGIGRDHAATDISRLALSVGPTAKVVVSCRSGDYTRNIEGLSVVSLRELAPDQIRFVTDAWLGGAADEFRKQLAAAAYGDVADRPLLLCQLLFLFTRNGYLPDQQSAIYRRLATLLLQDWDVERGVQRVSRYSGFLPERKAEFLAAIAYDLTFRAKRRIFAESDLIRSYEAVYERFGLPRNEATAVVREIESHSGIIVEAADQKFEFSHLSRQEYFCADYIVREPFPELLDHYAAEYSAPLAVAVALSSNPSAWFARLMLKHAPKFNATTLKSFLSRLAVEKPHFAPTAELGAAILTLFHEFGGPEAADLYDLIERFVDAFELHAALSAAISKMTVDEERSTGPYACLVRQLEPHDIIPGIGPVTFRIRKALLLDVMRRSPRKITYRDRRGRLLTLSGNETFLHSERSDAM